MDEKALLLPADLLALDHGAVVGDADLAGNLSAGRVRMHLGHRSLFKGALLNRPFLAILIELKNQTFIKI